MYQKYNAVVFILRGQPCHNAHIEILKRASRLADKLIVIIGSAYQPRTYDNPWTWQERESLIRKVCEFRISKNVELFIEPVRDSIYNNTAWAVRVQDIVAKYTLPTANIAIIGHEKDDSSFYLKMFPQWKNEYTGLIETLHASDIRDLYFRNDCNMNFLKGVVAQEVFDFLIEFKHDPAYQQIINEKTFNETYKRQYDHLIYAPTFVTTDAVVVQSGHVLLVKRRAEPGKGLWALPGGFLNAKTDKSLQDCMIRELIEETRIKLDERILVRNITGYHVFDAINRSARGRTITHAFHIELTDGPLPKVKGSDDAEKAKWVPLASVKSEMCFEDHFDIITHFTGI